MRPASFITTVGATSAGRDGRDIVIIHEPPTGATLRTRGRFYMVCEVDPPSRRASEIAAEVTEMARHEFYYDLSAGIEVGLRRALRKANRRAAQLVREERGRIRLHVACAVIVNNEIHAAKVGGAHVFLVRHARLFLPGEEPDELADFVHRTTTRQAASLGAEIDLLPLVWHQTIDAGDTIVLASGSVVDALGAEALKNAAITLHPRAAAEHVRSRAVAEGATGSGASIFIEISASAGAAARLGGEPESPADEPTEVVIAGSIRSRLGVVWRYRPRLGRILAALVSPITRAIGAATLVALELMPRRATVLPRRPESARRRSARVQRATSLLALLLLVVTLGIGTVVVRDYQANQVVADYRLAIVDVENEMAATRSFAGRKDTERAWEKLTAASDRLAVAARSPAADPARVGQLRDEIAALEDRLNEVVIDLRKIAASAAPADVTQTVHGLYAADPLAGRLWRIHGDPVTTGVVLERGKAGVGTPVAVTAQGEALLTLDDARTVWRAEGNTVAALELPKVDTWKSATALATFAGNVYVLDPKAGQVWRYEPDFQGKLDGPSGFLPMPLAPDTARALAVDGDIWVLTMGGEVQRYRRQGFERTLTRLPFTIAWLGTPLKPTHLQAIETQRSIWLLDAPARTVAQVTRDGREIARFTVPSRLPDASAFFVSEGQRIAYTIHRGKIAATDVSR
ncbi:MAG: hypothetical protein HYU87_06540 [Chloroflexi bacterium]|nr:hypothetical protein [Chloroflexota bacterium]